MTTRSVSIFNTLTRTRVPIPNKSLITLYVCGPTVYDSAHIGHGRTYTLYDAIRRVMRDIFNKDVVFAMNITDIDDKIVKRSRELKISRKDLTRKYENEFFEDMKSLGNERPTVVPRATEYIKEMIDFIGELSKKGFAYNTEDGSVYLDTMKASKTIDYPSLLGSGRSLDGSSDEDDGQPNKEKRFTSDFALWKGANSKDSKTDTWDATPWGGIGRPGWHLECSAMVHATLGKISGNGTIDIHGGGVDLCFPHHENERCQSQLLLGDNSTTPWASIFCHTGHVTVDKTKMSKSLGNFSTLRQVLQSNAITPRQLRLMFLSSARYSSSLEWNQGSIDKAKALDDQFSNALSATKRSSTTEEDTQREDLTDVDVAFIKDFTKARETIYDALADDFNFPGVFDEIQKLCKKLNRRSIGMQSKTLDKEVQQFLRSILQTLGFGGVSGVKPGYGEQDNQESISSGANQEEKILDSLVQFRAEVRNAAKTGNAKAVLQSCDHLRQNNPFALIQDMKDGTSIWKRKPQ